MGKPVVGAQLYTVREYTKTLDGIKSSLDRVAEAMDRLLAEMPRAEIIRTSLDKRGALVKVRDATEAVAVANRIAPEHLELSVADPQAMLDAGLRHWRRSLFSRHLAGRNHGTAQNTPACAGVCL